MSGYFVKEKKCARVWEKERERKREREREREMFAGVGAAGSCLASALASCAAVCACEACKCVGGSIARASARAVYVIFFATAVATAWLMRDYASPLMEKIPWLVKQAGVHPSDEWFGKQAVYRVTAGSALFSAIMAMATAGVSFRNDPRDAHVQHGAWGLKAFLFVVCLALPFFAPTGLIGAYVWIARLAGGLFLVLQMVILLDFTRSWNDSWVEKDNWQWLAGLLGATLACYALSIAAAVFLGIYFVPHASCSLNAFFIAAASILSAGFTAASLHPAVPSGSVFPSGVITAYSFYLLYSAMSSEPASYECNLLAKTSWGADPGNGASLIVGMSITLLSVVYSALRAGSSDIWGGSGDEDASGDGSSSLFAPVRDEEEPLVGPGEVSADRFGANDATAEYEPVSYHYSFFHITFALASMYVAMLMTGWSTAKDVQANTVDVGWASVWVKICSQWFAGLLYMWTLVAPLVFPDRDFS